MAGMTHLTFARGEDIIAAIDLAEGEPEWVQSIAADLRKLEEGARVLLPAQAIAASFTLTARLAAGDVLAGFNGRIPGATSFNLTTGMYLTDTRIVTVDGAILIGDPLMIQITEPATIRP